MAKEIERKYLVKRLPDLTGIPGVRMTQGYLQRGPVTVRIRRRADDAFLTVKGPANGISRDEFECPIPVADADAMLVLCGDDKLEKTRYCIDHGNLTYELDVFHGKLEGFAVVEIEIDNPDVAIPLFDWMGMDVSEDLRFTNAALCRVTDLAELRG